MNDMNKNCLDTWAEEAVRELLADCVEAIVFAMHAELTALVELPEE